MRALVAAVLERPARGARRSYFTLAAAVLGIATAIMILYPIVVMLSKFVVHDGALNTAAFADAWNQPGTVRMLVNTAIVVSVSTTLAVIIGSCFAWLNERTDARVGWLTETLPIVPMMVPPLAGTIGWILLATPGPGFLNVLLRDIGGALGLGTPTEGPLNVFSWYGLIFLYVLYLVPHVYLTVAAGLRNLDSSIEEASRINGAGPLRTLVRVTLPSVRPAMGGGALLALAIAIAMFSVPVLIAGTARINVLSVRILQLMTAEFPPKLDIAVVWGFVMIAVVGSAWWVQVRILAAGRHATIGAGRSSNATKVRLGGWRWGARGVMGLYLLITSVLPLVGLVIVSLQPFWQPAIHFGELNFSSYSAILFDQSTARTAFRNSVLLGVGGATVAMALAAVSSFYVQRGAGSPLRRAIDGVTKLPAALSQIVVAMAMIAAFSGPPFRLSGTLLILLIAYLIFYMPQATVTSDFALTQVDRSLSEASTTCGASQGRTFRKVVLPLMTPGLAAGWVFVFVLMAGDITGSVMLASTRTPVVGYTMLDLFNNGSYRLVAAMGTAISVMMTIVVTGALVLTRRRERRHRSAVRTGAGVSVEEPRVGVMG